MASSDSTYRPPTPSSGGRRTRLLGLLLTITLAAAFSAGAYAQQPAGIGDGAHRGYAAVRLSGGAPGDEYEVLDELNADGLFVPASVLKVFTVAAALEHLGADYQWLTRLTSNGAMSGTVLDGDLVIERGPTPRGMTISLMAAPAHPWRLWPSRFALAA